MAHPEAAPGASLPLARGRPAALHADRAVLIVGGLTVLAFVLRLVLLRDSLLGDELIMYDIVHAHGLGAALHIVRETEKTPPLHFVLAWVGAHVFEPRIGVRLPSLIAGTALVPVAYLIGRRTVGRTAALVGAAVLALQPYQLFYATEARAYATVTALTALSTLCLLHALETGRRGWWAGYGVAALAAAYTHYVAFFVLVVQVLWAAWVHRERLRTLVVVNALVVVGFLPWLPSFLLQQSHSGDEARRIALLAPPSIGYFVRVLGQVSFGQPFVSLRAVPSRAALVAGLLALAVGLVAAVLRARRVRRPAGVVLIVLLALATPVGIGLLSAVPHRSLLLPRNLIASTPAIALLFGWLVTSAGRRTLAVATTTVLLLALAVGAARALDHGNRRSAYRDAAACVDQRARPGDPVLEVFFIGGGALDDVLALNFAEPHRIHHSGGTTEAAAWAAGRRTGHVFEVLPLPGFFKRVQHLPRFNGPGKRFRLVAERRWQGIE